MFKNNFFRKVCITQFIFVIIFCILSNYINFISNHLGFVMAFILLFPYEILYNKDFNEYIGGKDD